MKNRSMPLLWILIPLLASCITTYNYRTLNLQILKPGLLPVDSIHTVAIFDRNYNYIQTDTFKYRDVVNNKFIRDTVIKYLDLQDTCTDALARYLQNSGLFTKVANYRDSMNNPVYAQEIVKKLKKGGDMDYDAFIFLNYFELYDELVPKRSYFNQNVLYSFPEFKHSSVMETVKTSLTWNVSYKAPVSNHEYKRPDYLFYGNSVDKGFFGSEENHRKLIYNAAMTLGQSFGHELLPHMGIIERRYYRSHNPQMLKAQRYLLSENYRLAAETYRPLTNNKNRNIVAKATYNMALICELEGNPEAAIDWIALASKTMSDKDIKRNYVCWLYIFDLNERIKEIKELYPNVKTDVTISDEQL